MYEQPEDPPELAFLDRRIVEVVERGAFVSLVVYNDAGIEYEIYVENSDLEFIETGIGYESE